MRPTRTKRAVLEAQTVTSRRLLRLLVPGGGRVNLGTVRRTVRACIAWLAFLVMKARVEDRLDCARRHQIVKHLKGVICYELHVERKGQRVALRGARASIHVRAAHPKSPRPFLPLIVHYTDPNISATFSSAALSVSQPSIRHDVPPFCVVLEALSHTFA